MVAKGFKENTGGKYPKQDGRKKHKLFRRKEINRSHASYIFLYDDNTWRCYLFYDGYAATWYVNSSNFDIYDKEYDYIGRYKETYLELLRSLKRV